MVNYILLFKYSSKCKPLSLHSYHQKYILRRHHELLDSLHLTDEDIITSPIACKLNGYLAGHGSLEDLDKV